MNPMTEMAMNIDNGKQVLSRTKALREKADQLGDSEEALEVLNKENILLNGTLKKMNATLTRFIELIRDLKIK